MRTCFAWTAALAACFGMLPMRTQKRAMARPGAPLVVKDQVIVGTSGGDSGVRGFVAAFNAETGELRWKFWTIPAPGEAGSASWPGDAYLHGGGTTWMPGTYDPELNLLYWTTSNPAPDFAGESRPGDDLYTDCVLALDADRGTLKWYFQFTPHDLYDYDANETPVLIDVDEHGERRRLLVQANRNGFLYILDRANGRFLKVTRFLEELTWAKGIDDAGRPHSFRTHPDSGRHSHLSRYRRGYQLVFAVLQPRDADVLFPLNGKLQHVLFQTFRVQRRGDVLFHRHKNNPNRTPAENSSGIQHS